MLKDYSVGKGRVHYYAKSAEEAFRLHKLDGCSRRVGVYEWDAEKRADGSIMITNPKRLPWPKDLD